jgi:hypothetical protein
MGAEDNGREQDILVVSSKRAIGGQVSTHVGRASESRPHLRLRRASLGGF